MSFELINTLKKEDLLPIDLLVINDNISEDTINKLRKAKVFDKKKVVIIIDQIVPANSPEASSRQTLLRNLALENDFSYIFGTDNILTYSLKAINKGPLLIASNSDEVVGASLNGSYGAYIDEDKLVEIYKTGILKNKPKELSSLKITVDNHIDSRATNLNILNSAKKLSKNGIYDISSEIFNRYKDIEISELIILLNKVGIHSICTNLRLENSPEIKIDSNENYVVKGDFSNIVNVKELKRKVNLIYIGGSVGGTVENIRKLVELINNKEVAYNTRLVVSPNNAESYVQAADEGLISKLITSGALVLNTNADPEIQARIGENETMLSLDVKTGKGYAGFNSSQVILTSIKYAAEAAVSGQLGEYNGNNVNNDELITFNNIKQSETAKNDLDLKFSETYVENTEKSISGKIWKFGDDIDTDIIIPTQYLTLPINEMINHAFEPLKLNLSEKIKPGDIIVASDNFGAGSSREQAAEVIAAMGVKVIIAGSFARIFFRNAINNGILLVENKDLHKHVSDGDTVTVVINEYIKHDDKKYKIGKVQNNLLEIIHDGGLVKNVEKRVKRGEL